MVSAAQYVPPKQTLFDRTEMSAGGSGGIPYEEEVESTEVHELEPNLPLTKETVEYLSYPRFNCLE